MASTDSIAERCIHALTATRSLRRMRGQTQAQLVETESGQAYVTKFQNNPCGRRVLASEWVGGLLMQRLGLPLPAQALIQAPGFPEMSDGGLNFGSSYPGDPNKDAVYDFIPDRLLARLHNHSIFVGACVFDLWAANADRRGVVFCRTENANRAFEALLIDNSHLFGGPAWAFAETEETATFMSRAIYRDILTWDSLSPWLQRIEQIARTDIMWVIANSVPEDWLCGSERSRINQVVETLINRSRTLPERIDSHFRSRPELFPNWQPRSGVSISARRVGCALQISA